MSTVEAAASLFGSDGDSRPDPFAVIGNEATDTTPPHDEHQVHNSSHSLQMGQDTSSWFAEQIYPDPQQEQHDPWLIPTAQDGSSGQPHRPSGLSPSYDQQQRYNPGANAYEPHSAYNTPLVTSTAHQNTSASYEPYNPTPLTHHQPYGASQYPAQPSYNPYKPTTATSSSNPYAPPQPKRQLSAVPAQPQVAQPDNYNSVSRSVPSPYLASFAVASPQQLPNGIPAQTAKPSPAPTAAEFRPKTSNAYDPPLPPPRVHRTTSPSSLRFTNHLQGLVSHTSHPPPINPYDHRSMPAPPRTMSPSSIRSVSPPSGSVALSKTVPAYTSSQPRGRSASNGSTLSSQGVLNPVPPRKEYGLGFGPHIAEPSLYSSQSHQSVEQDICLSRAIRPPYAPSPSLLGSNDPLGRTSSRAPVISFGFGGKLLTCFHSSADPNTGFDVALSSRRTTNVTIRVLHQLLPDYMPETKATEFPGPLFSDLGTPVTGLVRTGTSQAKTKKARVIKYLEERAEELLRGTMYTSNNIERQRLEGKLILAQLLKIMVENDGSLSGSPAVDDAVRTALLPRIVGTMDVSGHDGLPVPALTSPMPNTHSATSMLLPAKETPVSVSTLHPSALDKIQEFLVRGERRQAYRYALDERLWAHAMIIASSVDKEAWKEVVNEFLKAELGVHEPLQRATPHVNGKGVMSQPTNGREWLRVTYSVFSGQGPAAVQELVPMNLLSRTATGLQLPPMLPHIPPVSPNFSSTTVATQIPVESLSKWPEIAASIISTPLNPEYSATLSALGDCLVSHHLVEGAHVCYLLSPQTSVMGGLGGPGTRLVLLGSQSPHINPVFFRDPDPIIFTEIAEFALSLQAPIKGQEPFHGFPHLQAYKFIQATYLADIGQVQTATRYCDAITAAMGRPSPYFTPALVEGLKQLADRLLGSPHIDKATSWIGGKVSKPSLDSIGNWIEVRLTKFIAGEGNETTSSASEFPKAQFAGPFSNYSSISSAMTSASPSPPPTVINSHIMPSRQPPTPRRSGSAMALPSTTMHIPVDRASSAMEYHRPTRHASPAPPKTAPLHSTGYRYSPEPSSRKTSLEMTVEEGSEIQKVSRDERELHDEDQRQPKDVDGGQETRDSGSWWSSLNNTDSTPTPTIATFHVENAREVGEGFISLMDDPALSVTPIVTTPSPQQVESGFDGDDDLGLGNTVHRKKQDTPAKIIVTEDKPPNKPAQDTTKVDEKPDPRPTTASSTRSWFSRIWKPSETPALIQASLGEETSFIYDKELKRWVNKKGGAEAVQRSAPSLPPSRAQTASPSVRNSYSDGTSNRPVAPPQAPPPRTASAIDLSTSPTYKVPMRVRSNLAPTEVASMPNTPAPSSMPNPPPMGRSRSQAAKRNVRNRYVDVFQQNGS
ncbi:Sec23-binding domain of Sec16-domain-containing protein [Boletus reticuloceps]|uniref:Protein transport protein sec16 n=1 Tax=Boletus reticuloceps TaxID=495285 RepID=A0A8I2YPS2_9AGAM|nr:Sec23-binding domain of Sec16-domain-containing protein [Boletus reticuloceps]